jgi:hypothetical protein
MVVSFLGRGNRDTRRKYLTDFITWYCIEYTLLQVGVKLTNLNGYRHWLKIVLPSYSTNSYRILYTGIKSAGKLECFKIQWWIISLQYVWESSMVKMLLSCETYVLSNCFLLNNKIFLKLKKHGDPWTNGVCTIQLFTLYKPETNCIPWPLKRYINHNW